jgi:8-amino-7-oxononanoate synthase
MIERDSASGLRPVILADGFCPDCGRAAPLQQYLQSIVRDRGYVVLDDTQALGIWGQAPDELNPYGTGGGGSLRLHNIRSPAVIVGSSLAKGFGVPLAMLGGSAKLIRQFARRSETRIHASPPSIAVLHAAEHALIVNAVCGNSIRRYLAELVTHFCELASQTSFSGSHSPFPVQMLDSDPYVDPVRLHRRLSAAGMRALVVRERTTSRAKLLFVFNALHSIDDVDQAANALAAAVDGPLAHCSFHRRRIHPSPAAHAEGSMR